MQSVPFAHLPLGRTRRDLAKQVLEPIAFLLRAGDPAATIDRLFTSRHVRDLQLIVASAFVLLGVSFLVALPLTYESVIRDHDQNTSLDLFSAVAKWLLKFYGPAVVAFGALLAWAYRVGSARLGVVDLFACEISTLCRVVTIVDTVGRFVIKFESGPPLEHSVDAGPPARAPQFTSLENYFPVFDANNRDLQTLEATVVINITAFYTYMKAVRDSLRSLAEIRPRYADFEVPANETPAPGSWHEAARTVIYMMYLSLESARHAIADLVEFEPEQAERTIVILISELEAFSFLCRQFTAEDVHRQRLALRESVYLHLVPQLCSAVEDGRRAERDTEAEMGFHFPGHVSQWEPACRLLQEMNRRLEGVRELSMNERQMARA